MSGRILISDLRRVLGESDAFTALLDAVEAARDMVTTAVLAGHPMSEELEAALGRFDFGDER